jgi:hypothetical protein
MNKLLRIRLDMATRVRDFLRAHKTDVVGEGPELARLEELVQRADELVAKQRAGLAAARSTTKQRSGIRDTLQTALLKYLRAVSLAAAKENTDLLAQFELPHRNVSHRGFLAAVKVMLVKAIEQKDLLVSHGMKPSLLDDLGTTLAEFEKTLEGSRAGRRDHMGATADLKAITAEILEQVRVLDGLMWYRFRDNAELMGEWAGVRNVLGPFQQKKQQPVPPEAGSQTPKAA